MASAPDVSLALSMDLLNKFQLCLDYLLPDQPPCVSFQPPPSVNDSPDAYPSLSPACPATALSPLSIKVEAFSVNDRPRLRIYAIRSGNGSSNESALAAPSMPTPPSSMASLPVYPAVQNGWAMFQQTESGLTTPSGSSSTSESEPYSPPMSSGVTTPSDFPVALPSDTNPFPALLSQSLNHSTALSSSPQIPGPAIVNTLPTTWSWDDSSMINPDFVRAMGVTDQWNHWNQPNDPSMFPSASSSQFVMPPPLSGPGIDGDFDKLGLPPLDLTPSDQDEEVIMDTRSSLPSTSEARQSSDTEQVSPSIPLVNASQPDHQINQLSGCPSPPPSPQSSTSPMLAASTQASGEHVFSINSMPAPPASSPTLPLPCSPASPESSSSNGLPIRTARRRGVSSASLDGNTCSCHAQKSDGVKSRSKKQHMHCSDCEETFTRRHDLLRHEVRLHGKVCDWVCERCEKFFSSAARLKRHECSIVPRLANRPPVTATAAAS